MFSCQPIHDTAAQKILQRASISMQHHDYRAMPFFDVVNLYASNCNELSFCRVVAFGFVAEVAI